MAAAPPQTAVLAAQGAAAQRLDRSDFFWRNPLADAQFHRVTHFESSEIDAALSAGGKLAVFASNRQATLDAWVHQVDGEFLNLTKGSFPDLAHEIVGSVRFSCDGSQVWLRRTGEEPLGRSVPDSVWLAPTLGGVARPLIERAMMGPGGGVIPRKGGHAVPSGDTTPGCLTSRPAASANSPIWGRVTSLKPRPISRRQADRVRPHSGELGHRHD